MRGNLVLPSIRSRAAPIALALALTLAAPAAAQRAEPARATAVSAYADLADLALAAPVVVRGQVDRVDRLSERDAPGVAPGWRRYLVRLRVIGALKAPGAVPELIQYLWDAPGRRVELRRADVLAFLAPVPGRADQFRLTSPQGQIVATPAVEATVRAQLAEARDPALARRRVLGVTRAFTVAGTVPGEAETQIFLRTASAEPVSLVVVSRPGEPKRWSAAFGDTIDEAGSPVAPATLAWYYLACGLPATLPAEATEELDAETARAATDDFAFVRRALGPCGRTLRPGLG